MKNSLKQTLFTFCFLISLFALQAQGSSYYDQEPNDCLPSSFPPSSFSWHFGPSNYSSFPGYSNYAGDFDYFKIYVNGTYLYLKIWAVGGKKGQYWIKGKVINNQLVITKHWGKSIYIHFYDSDCILIDGDWSKNTNSLDLASVRLSILDNSNTTEDNVLDEVIIYPNPVSEFLNVTLPKGTENISGKLLDITGKIIIEFSSEGSFNHQLDVRNLNPGMYILNLKTENESLVKKILIN